MKKLNSHTVNSSNDKHNQQAAVIDDINTNSQSLSKKKNLMSSFFKTKSSSSPNMNSYINQMNNNKLNSNSNNSSNSHTTTTNSNQNNSNQINTSTNNINNNNSNSSNSSNINHSVTVKVDNAPTILKKSTNSNPVISASCPSRSNSTLSDSLSDSLSGSPQSESEELLTRSGTRPFKSNTVGSTLNSNSSNQNTLTIMPNNNNKNNIVATAESNEKLNSSTNSSTSSASSSSNKTFTIISKPSSETSWEAPSDYDIEGTKINSIKDIEFILSRLSATQKTLNDKSSTNGANVSNKNISNLTASLNPQISAEEDLEKTEKKSKVRHDISVITEIFKHYNFGYDEYDLLDGDVQFHSMLEDEMERKTFLLAKQVLFLKMEMNKAVNPKRAFILNTVITSISKFLSTGTVPKQIPAIPLEMTITMGLNNSLLPHINNTIYKKGFLTKRKNRTLGGPKFSQKWVVLSHSEIFIYSSEKEDQLLIKKPLNELSSIQINSSQKEGLPSNSFTLFFSNIDFNNEIIEEWGTASLSNSFSSSSLSASSNNNGSSVSSNSNKKKTMTFTCESQDDLAQWVLAIDGVSNSNFKSTMDLNQKELYLHGYKTNYKGGSFRFGEEEWIYCDGKLTNQCWGDLLEYHWDGCTLVPSPHSKLSLGKGRWNGVWLTWYCEEKIKEPYLKFLYQPNQKQYIVDSFPIKNQYIWTWSRHFLVSSGHGGEWIVEGDVPPVLVMLVQMMKYYRVGR
ncbi:hypothetical protein CYY_003761 [Polysphondylium violaceum]|uniref:PH domain-containing protein n=1 Tax=Polysphondylium violaceum TaxID=133409 RepID=A0A8J4PU91_9MYCE|nr:hypothetical protein CYY_003761 [Polysphondylium violaceum]